MTKLTDPSPTERSALQRVPLAVVLTVVGMFFIGITVGVIVALASKGALPAAGKLWLIALPLVSLPLGLVSLQKAWRLAAPPSDASGFERRYWKMWLWVCLLGAPIGMALVLPELHSGNPHSLGHLLARPFTNSPIDPVFAVLLTIGGMILCVVAFGTYHRTIDEQEERGYLWGSQIAFYFLSLAFPAWWLLQRGDLVPALTVGLALALVLVSFIIQAVVWAWFKFR